MAVIRRSWSERCCKEDFAASSCRIGGGNWERLSGGMAGECLRPTPRLAKELAISVTSRSSLRLQNQKGATAQHHCPQCERSFARISRSANQASATGETRVVTSAQIGLFQPSQNEPSAPPHAVSLCHLPSFSLEPFHHGLCLGHASACRGRQLGRP